LTADEEASIRIHAVVPARDEADVISRTLPSLVDQRYAGPLEITLVDDHSSDGTAQAAADSTKLHPNRSRLEILSAGALPAGWTGKIAALQSGVAAHEGADPDYWLFTDADIEHDPENLRYLVAWARAERLELASLMVQLHCEPSDRWESLLIPAFVYFFMKLYPFDWIRDPRNACAGASGGCMLIEAQALRRIGGLAAIKGRVIDDCSLAAALKSGGRRIDLRLTATARSVRPYAGLATIWAMVRRSAFTQLGESYPMVALTAIGMTVLYVVPPLALAEGLRRRDPRLAGPGAIGYGLMTATYLPTVRMYGLRPRDALTLPIAALLYTAMTIDSAWSHLRKRGAAWKGRAYGVTP
jgi:hopene-associated glycosyltransferase HpnB